MRRVRPATPWKLHPDTDAPALVPVQEEEQPRSRWVEFLTVAERAERGRQARAQSPRRSHGRWAPSSSREDPIALLDAQAETRVPELLPFRYGRMAASPFSFYRGAAAVMAADLAETPHSGFEVQLCGDAHLSNFGGFYSPERTLIFDINDFDETLPGPWEWDLKRLAASFEVAGRARGFRAATRREIVLAAGAYYRDAMATFAGQNTMDVWYARFDVAEYQAALRTRGGNKRENRAAADRILAYVKRARRRTHEGAFARLTAREVRSEPRFASAPPLIVPLRDLYGPEEAAVVEDAVEAILRAYLATLPDDRRHVLEQFHPVDVARKVVGVGSVGTRAWIGLMLGRDGDDPLILQFKEAQPSVLEKYLGRSKYVNHGRRVVEGQRLMQSASDIVLSWTRVRGIDGVSRDYYVRQLWDGKVSVNVDTARLETLVHYAQVCAWTLARAHARSGDAVGIASYLGNSDAFPEALADFASIYADQNERDYEALLLAIKDGRLPAELGI